jgi:leucyl-tRNA synthetase
VPTPCGWRSSTPPGRRRRGLWAYALDRFAAVEEAPVDEEAETDTAFMRERLLKWCDAGLERITDDLVELQMHKAVRNVTRLLERIQQYEKRVQQRRGALSRADAEALAGALVLLLRVLAPFAPHFAEGLLLAAGREADLALLDEWPAPVETPSR